MPTFTQALVVEVGSYPTAAQQASLAAAFNSRLLSGVGDGPWRLAFNLHGLVRKIRNDDGTLETPDGEFWNIYQHVDPNDNEWPATGPGEPGGTNVANILGAWTYGVSALDIGSENFRLSIPPVGIEGVDVLTARHFWSLGALQRGAYDPSTGLLSWPMGDLARAFWYVRQSLTSPYGNDYGGWIPFPEDAAVTTPCANPLDQNLQLLFTSLVDGSTKTYTSNCPEDPNAVVVYYPPDAYVIVHASGEIEVLPKSQWIEGPYTSNAQLSKIQGSQLASALNAFASEFRGTAAQRIPETNKAAFDAQRFLTTQYPLAPAYGNQIGDSVNPLYPGWRRVAEQINPNTILGCVQGGTTFTWPEGTVATGFVLVASKILRGGRVELREGSTVLKVWDVKPGEVFDELWNLPTARALSNVSVVCRDLILAEPQGGVMVEGNALLEYYPQIHDLYAVLRLSAYRADLTRIDGRGIDTDQAKAIGTNLYNRGCIVPVTETSPFGTAAFDPVFNQNAVVDAARRMTKWVRIIPWTNLTGYAVENGDSVLWFNPIAYGPPSLAERNMWDGVGPRLTPITSGEIKWGRLYKVRSGQISYGPDNARQSFSTGQTFTGQRGVPDFGGSGVVYEADGIKATAEPGDFSNRWALSVLSLKPYTLSDSSLWKIDAFAGVKTPFWDRCNFDSPEINASKIAKRHVSYGIAPLVPETPPGYAYLRVRDAGTFTHSNRSNCAGDPVCEAENEAFYRSCRIYEPPVEIRKVELDGAELKVTLKGRLHRHHTDSPTSLDRDPTTWDIAALHAENYRTWENGIRDFIVFDQLGTNSPWRIGDNARNSSMQTNPDAPLGACLPTIQLTQLIPEPYLAANDTYQDSDSPFRHDTLRQAAYYLQAMAPGFVDGVTTAQTACDFLATSAYDYTFANLIFQAVGNRNIPVIGAADRPDNPYGFGPLPNTNAYAEVFNALAKGVNLLDTARIMLPSELESRTRDGNATSSTPALDECGNPLDCTAVGTDWFAYAKGKHLSASPVNVAAWTGGTGASGANAGYQISTSMDSGERCSGSNWVLSADIVVLDLRWAPLDPLAVYALPGNLASLMDTNAVVAMSTNSSVSYATISYSTTVPGPDLVQQIGLCGSVYAWWTVTEILTSECSMGVSTITPPAIPAGLVASARWDTSELPGTRAGAGGSSSTSVTVYEDGTSLVRIPTEPYTGGS